MIDMINRFRSILFCWVITFIVFVVIPFSFGSDSKIYLKVAVLEDFPPQYSLSADGVPEGFAVDTITEIARLANADIQFVVKTDWTAMFEALRSGEVDLIPNQGVTEQRKEWFVFTSPVETFPVRVFVRSTSKKVSTLEDMAGRKVGVVRLNVGERLLTEQPAIQTVVYDHLKDAFFDLLAGSLDGIVYPEPVLRMLARKARLEDRITAVGPPLIEIKRAVSVLRSNEALLKRLDNAVGQFVGSPTYERIYAKWYGEVPPLFTTRQMMVLMGAVLMVVVITMAWWRYRSLVRINADLIQNIHKREQAEKKLKEAHDQLENRVRERTASLATTNEKLVNEIDKRKTAENLLREKEQFLASIFDSIQDGISVLTPDLKIVHTNKAMQGWYADHLPLENKLCFEVYRGLKDSCNDCPTLRAIHSRKLEMQEVPLLQGGKESGVLELYAFPMFNDDGAVIGAVEYVRDISKRKLAERSLADSERRLADIIEFLPDPTFVIDLNRRVIAWNLAMERLTGLAKKDIIGNPDFVYSTPFYEKPRPMLIDLALKRDSQWEKQYLSMKEKDGLLMESESFHPSMGENGLYFAGTAGRLYSADGDVVGAIETIRDITHTKQTEQEREKLIAELKEALEKVRTLSGLLPMCAKCKKVRDDSGYWNQLETYISQHTDANVTHGLCPDCMDSMYSGQEWYERGKKKGRF
jgi:PAS domain S-box-containing protein